MQRILPLLDAHAYIRLFRGRTFVIKVSGSILADAGARAALAEDVAVLHHVGIYQRGLATLTRRFEAAGFPTVVSGGLDLGPLARFVFAYFDTRAALGFYVEILDFAWLGERPVPVRPLVERCARLQRRGGELSLLG